MDMIKNKITNLITDIAFVVGMILMLVTVMPLCYIITMFSCVISNASKRKIKLFNESFYMVMALGFKGICAVIGIIEPFDLEAWRIKWDAVMEELESM